MSNRLIDKLTKLADTSIPSMINLQTYRKVKVAPDAAHRCCGHVSVILPAVHLLRNSLHPRSTGQLQAYRLPLPRQSVTPTYLLEFNLAKQMDRRGFSDVGSGSCVCRHRRQEMWKQPCPASPSTFKPRQTSLCTAAEDNQRDGQCCHVSKVFKKN